MHIILAIVSIISIIYVVISRIRMTTMLTGKVLDAADEVRLAARRFGYKCRKNQHPIDAINDSKIAIVAAAIAFSELNTIPTHTQRKAYLLHLQVVLGISGAETEELIALGKWLVAECKDRSFALMKLVEKISELGGLSAEVDFLTILRNVQSSTNIDLSAHQVNALKDIQFEFGL